jgi:hypothetical protein
MKNSMLMPCADWVEKLAIKYPDDLTYAERVALNVHLASCSTCAAIHSSYQVIGERINNLPPVEPLPGLPYELLQREKCTAPYAEQLETTSPGILAARIGMTIRSVVQSKLWLSLLEKIHAAFDHLHQRVIYVSSDDHHLYAFRNDNSSVLWKYKKSHVFFSSPAVKNGVAYLTPFDTQMFLFRARIRPCGDSFLWK